MSRFLIFFFVTALLTFLIDYWVYWHWAKFARKRAIGQKWLTIYRGFMTLMPLVLPLYFLLSRWWEVEPKWIRAFIIGFWGFYYLPKALIAGVLLILDSIHLLLRIYRRFKRRHPPASRPTSQHLMNRRTFIETTAWSLAGIPYILTGYSMVKTLYDFQIHTVELPIRSLPSALEGLRIVQISDLHAGSFLSLRPMHEVVELVLEQAPDLILITGDYVNHEATEIDPVLPILHRLKAPLGVFGCLGNHDHYAAVHEVIRKVNQTPVHLLINNHHTFSIDGARLHLIGTDNTGFGQNFGDLRKATRGLQRHPAGEEFTLLLAHDPSFWDREVRKRYPFIDLTLSGHTHGGQIGIELGPIRWSLAKLAYERWAGLYQEEAPNSRGQQKLYVNRGIGTVGPPIRMGIRPEITTFTLRRAA